MSRSKIMRLLVCITLLVSLVSCSGGNQITSKRLSGKLDFDPGKPISLSNHLAPDYISHALTQRGDEILLSMPSIKEGGGIITSKPSKIKGDIFKMFSVGYYGREGLVFISSKSGEKYYLYSFILDYTYEEPQSCHLEKLFEVETKTPRIVASFGKFESDYSKVSNDDDFIICQSLDFGTIAYYDMKGKVLNEYSIGKIALSKTHSDYGRLYGFDGKEIHTMSPIMTSKTRMFTTNRYKTTLNFDLDSTDFWFSNDLLFSNKTNFYIVSTSFIKDDKKLIVPDIFTGIQGFDFSRFGYYVEKSDGIYTISNNNPERKYMLNQIYNNTGKLTYNGRFWARLGPHYLLFAEETDNKLRFVAISEDIDRNYQYNLSNFLETDKMPIWFDTSYYNKAIFYNADGVWLTNSSNALNQ